jgi:predicted small secreted protein
MKTIIAIVIVTMLTACGTVAGVGTDIAGAANWTKDKMGGSK